MAPPDTTMPASAGGMGSAPAPVSVEELERLYEHPERMQCDTALARRVILQARAPASPTPTPSPGGLSAEEQARAYALLAMLGGGEPLDGFSFGEGPSIPMSSGPDVVKRWWWRTELLLLTRAVDAARATAAPASGVDHLGVMQLVHDTLTKAKLPPLSASQDIALGAVLEPLAASPKAQGSDVGLREALEAAEDHLMHLVMQDKGNLHTPVVLESVRAAIAASRTGQKGVGS